MDLSQYQALVFDCDGVVLNSNEVKTQAFYDATLGFGEDKAQAMVSYHVENGGVSRYLKFEYFIKEILKQSVTNALLEELLGRFASEVVAGLMQSEIAEGLNELRKKTSHAKWLIVSGGDQDELHKIFAARGLSDLFDGGIFGSPDSKEIILGRELSNNNIKAPALFLGDSKYDFQSSTQAGLDFVFLTEWTEVADWKEWAQMNRINTLAKVSDLSSQN